MYFVRMDSYGKHMPISSPNLLIPFPLLSHPPGHCLRSRVASVCPTKSLPSDRVIDKPDDAIKTGRLMAGLK